MIQRLLLLLAALAAYANALRAGLPFDSIVLVEDARVQSWSWRNLYLIFHENYWGARLNSGAYRPVVTLSYALQHGQPVWAYHLVNLILHLGVILLAYELLRQISPPVAFWAALLWAVHPVNTEAVTNVAGRADLLAACGVIGGLLLYRLAAQGIRFRGQFGVLGLVVLIGCFSKESAVVILPLALLWDWHSRRRPEWRALLAVSLPVALLIVARFVLRLNQHPPFSFLDNPLVGASFFTAKLTAVKVIGKMLWLWLWPSVLSADYSFNQIPLVGHSVSGSAPWLLLGFSLIVAVLWAFTSRVGAVPFWLLFGAICLLPTANILFLTGSIMGERFLYLPGLGLAALAVGVIMRLAGGIAGPEAPERKLVSDLRHRPLVTSVLLLAVFALTARTIYRNRDYRDEITFWAATVDASPDSFKTHAQVAALAFDRKLSGLAVQEADRTAEILETVPEEYQNFGMWAELYPYYREAGLIEKSHRVGDRVAEILNRAKK